MILAANQPYFFPYIAYWQLIKQADVFVVADNFNYIKNGWINRNRILINGEPAYFRLGIKNPSQNRYISQHSLQGTDFEKLRRDLQYAYGKAPYFTETMQVVEKVFACEERNLADFLVHSIRVVCSYLGIDTPILRTSQMEGNDSFKREERIFDMCRRLNADVYVNPIGGVELYSFAQFRQEGITLAFLKTKPVEYQQFGKKFVPNLSILDLMMFHSQQELQQLMEECSIWKEEDIQKEADNAYIG